MKKRTRIIAAFLTLIMVVGLLPLSLFAVENAAVSELKASEKSWASVKSALESKNFIPVLYQDFENQTVGSVAQSTLVFKTDSEGQPTTEVKTVNLTKVGSAYIAGRNLELKNYRQVFEIKEENGNKALYHGIAGNTTYSAHNDAYMDIMGAGTARGHDIFLSVDIKMGGKNIATTGESLIDFINRDNGRFNSHVIWVSNVGGLYLDQNIPLKDTSPDKNISPESLIGYLSDTEYTSISVHVKLSENKCYVYINDVLVTPEGKQFVEVAEDGTYNNTGKTVSEYALSQIRVYTAYENTTEEAHKGLYFDNIILASRAQRNEHNTVYEDLFVSDFSKGEIGKGLVASENMPGTAAAGSSVALTANTELPAEKILSYVKDGGDTVLKVGKPSGAGNGGQSYFSIFGLASYVGKNMSISVDFKMGTETLGNGYQIINPKYRGVKPAVSVFSVYLEKDGRIMYGSKELGRASAEKYTNFTVGVACNESVVTVYMYVDGELKHTTELTGAPWASPAEYYFNDVALFAGYTGCITNMKENELYVKNVSASLTDRYNGGRDVCSPFKADAEGFVKTAGITRYIDADGSIKRSDFTVDGVKYLVGLNGNVLGAERDGIEMSYAEYFESTFTYGTDKNVKLAEYLDASCFGVSTDLSMLKPKRAGYNAAVTAFGKAARYYASYIATTSTGSSDSYWDYNVSTAQKNDATVVMDFDIMLDMYTGANYAVNGLVTTKGFDASGKRTTMNNDTFLLSVDANSWLKAGDKFLVPLSRREFTKISVIVHTPTTGQANGKYDVYVNGVLMVEDLPLASGMYGLQGFRSFEATGKTAGMYVRNISYYTKTDKPMQYYTLENGALVLTNNQEKTPVKASDLKQGKVSENGIYRYYDQLGLPVINGTVTIDGKEYGTNVNGKIGCSETSHLGEIVNGKCVICDGKADGVTLLYGNSLVLGSDVKVVFYFDVTLEKALGASVEIGRETDFGSGKTVKTPITELDTIKIAGKTYYKVGYGVPAKDIDNDVKARLVRADGTYGTEYVYSAKNYIDAVKAAETGVIYSEALKSLVKALETYSQLAEKELENENLIVDVSSLAGINVDSFTSAGVNDAVASVGSANKTEATAENPSGLIIRTKYTLSLDSNVRMLFTFKIEKGIVSDYVFKIDGNAVNPILKSDGMYYVDVTVAAKNFNKEHTLTVENADGENLVTLNSSVLGFAKNNLAKSTDETHKNLMKAIFNYWQVADMYSKYTNSEDNSIIGPAEIQSALAGKTVYSFGDSLLAGHYSGLGMIDGLAKEYGMVYTKYAVNGATINLAGASVYAQVQRASAICPDFIVFDGLTNDVGSQAVGLNYPIGEISEGFDAELDATTFCGSFESTLKLMKEKYPTAKIVFVTPHKMPTRHLDYFKQLVDLAKLMCAKWGISVADIYYGSDVDTCDTEMKKEYSYDKVEGDRVGNGTHLTSTGYNIFYAPIISKIMAESVLDTGVSLSALEGKTVYSFGDSLLAGHYSGNGMVDGLAKEYGMVYTKYAVNGATINRSSSGSIYNQVQNASAVCPDFIVFDGLTNDVSNTGLNYPIGEISEGFDAKLDATTFCGSFESTLKLMKEKYPTARIVFVTPHKMPTRHLDYFKQLVDIAKEICEKWGVTVADVYYAGTIDTTIDAQRVVYSYNNQSESEGNGNGTHLTGIGYDIFYAPVIVRVMAKELADESAEK